MRKLTRRFCLFGVPMLTLAALSGSPIAASAAGGLSTCQGGSVAPGTYSSLQIVGHCVLDAGSVIVQGNLTVAAGAGLLAAFGGSNLTVGRNLDVGTNGILVLGCEPQAFPCFNDDPNNPTMSTQDSVGGNLTSSSALMMLVHNNHVGGNISQSNGGGGVTCDTHPVGPNGPPAYSTYEDNIVGGNAVIAGLRTCWLGFIRNTVHGNVNFTDNITADPDGNEVVTNSVGRNLNCSANNPAPQMGDSGGSPNTVSGRATGQCVGLTA